MAQILISEPHAEVCRLLERMVSRLGHEPTLMPGSSTQELARLAAFIVEPAAQSGLATAKALSVVLPELPILCVSVAAAPDVGISFSAALLKPFTLEQLRGALERAEVVSAASRPMGYRSPGIGIGCSGALLASRASS